MRAALLVLAFVLLLLLLLPPLASAGAEDVPLPAGWTKPTDVAFAPDGALVVTLQGNWALGRIDLATNASALVPLASAPLDEQDTMWDLRFADDGTAWTASGATAHRVRFGPPQLAQAFPLPSTSQLVGDVYLAHDGSVWIAQVDMGKLLRLDPRSGQVVSHDVGANASGPLTFDEAPDGTVFLVSTYANTYARFDPMTGALRVVDRSGLLSPVGLSHDANGTLWAAEMGASRVSAIFPTSAGISGDASARRVGYPTTPSAYYAVSGPSGIVAAKDGIVWFAEHFADRVARLDPVNGTLVEYELASAPGTNVQRLALAPDGAVWAAQYSRDRLARVTYGGEVFSATLPANVTLAQGDALEIAVAAPGTILVGSDDENLTSVSSPGKISLHAGAQTPVGDHRVVVATKQGKTSVGRYVIVHVTAASKHVPGAPLVVVLGLVALLGIMVSRVSSVSRGRRGATGAAPLGPRRGRA